MVRVMPAWVVAILVAFVGLAGASIGTFANIANDRVKDLRTRMLDAADEFVTAMTRAHEAIESAALPTGLWIEIAWMDMSHAMREDRQAQVEASHAAATSAWESSRQRVPRVALLFGVDSPTAEPLEENLVVERATERLEAATTALREFSAAAHAAITGWRPVRRRD